MLYAYLSNLEWQAFLIHFGLWLSGEKSLYGVSEFRYCDNGQSDLLNIHVKYRSSQYSHLYHSEHIVAITHRDMYTIYASVFIYRICSGNDKERV